jgi:Cu2+-containing amine oxidase
MRLARPLCFLRSDATDNGYVRPLEGLRPVVDLNTMMVIRVEEYTSNGQASALSTRFPAARDATRKRCDTLVAPLRSLS